MPLPRQSANPRQARRKDARPSELIDAALEVFGERGFASARLEDIAQRAGVTKGTVYLYFPGKERLFETAVRQTLVEAIQRAQTVVRDFEGPTPALLGLVLHGWWRGIVRGKAAVLPKLMMAEAANFPALARFYHDNVIEPGRAVQRRILERGMARGEFRRVPVEHYVHFIIAPFLYVQCIEHSFARVLPGTGVGDGFPEAFIEHLLAALALPGAAT